MAMTKDQIIVEAMALTPAERQALAEQLLLSLNDDDREAIDAAWLEEARARDAKFARGEMRSSNVDDAVARALSKGQR